jgi:hypothetical protein
VYQPFSGAYLMAFRFSFRPVLGRNSSRFSLAAARRNRFSCRPLLAVFLLPLILSPTSALAYKNVGAGSSSIPCNTYYQGAVGFNYSTLNLEYCDGTNWDTVLSNLSSDDQIDLGTSVTATNPSISGDLTSGLFSPAASTVAIATGGVQRLTVNSSGNVGIGTASPVAGVENAINGAASFTGEKLSGTRYTSGTATGQQEIGST